LPLPGKRHVADDVQHGDNKWDEADRVVTTPFVGMWEGRPPIAAAPLHKLIRGTFLCPESGMLLMTFTLEDRTGANNLTMS
ncbi:MAG TPA: hypothetical protein VG448_02845, partial [Solirubrobacterales bacterium]|nr:hypothetical protein [Solirubrobacterales bacterium]